MPNANETIVKEALKEALKEWLDEKYAAFGRWSIKTLAALFLSSVISIIIYANWMKIH